MKRSAIKNYDEKSTSFPINDDFGASLRRHHSRSKATPDCNEFSKASFSVTNTFLWESDSDRAVDESQLFVVANRINDEQISHRFDPFLLLLYVLWIEVDSRREITSRTELCIEGF